jgi:hypothetical protein
MTAGEWMSMWNLVKGVEENKLDNESEMGNKIENICIIRTYFPYSDQNTHLFRVRTELDSFSHCDEPGHFISNGAQPWGEKRMCSISVIFRLLRGLSPRANSTDRATAACRRSLYQLLRIEAATWSAWLIPPAVISDFRPEPLFFLSSSSSHVLTSLSGPRSRPTASQKIW